MAARRVGRVGTWCASVVLSAVVAGPAGAHGIAVTLRGTGAATVAFHYTDGTAMAGAEYRVFAPGGDFPVATGSTGAGGEVPLRASTDGRWRIEVEDRAGHASRARLDVADGRVALAGQRIPDWFVAVSLFLNVLLGLVVAIRRPGRTAIPQGVRR